ncbi:MAG: hypothetical protein P8X74_09760 [Reinekea sp.]
MLPKNFNEPMGAPAIFEKQIEIKLLHPASTMESWIQVLKKEIYHHCIKATILRQAPNTLRHNTILRQAPRKRKPEIRS